MSKLQVVIFVLFAVFTVKSHCYSCIDYSGTLTCDSINDLHRYLFSRFFYIHHVNVEPQVKTENSETFVCDGQLYPYRGDGVKNLTISNAGVLLIPKNCTMGMDKLEYIDLDSNIIPELTLDFFENFEKVEIIKLNNNQIKKLDTSNIKSLPKIRSFDAIGNQLNSFTFKISGGNYFNLNVAYNNISRFEIENNALQSLNLSYNRIETFSGNDLVVSARVLDLSHNYLTTITEDMVKNVGYCVIFQVSHNRLHSIYLPVNYGLTTYADISFNNLTSIENVRSNINFQFKSIILNNNKINKLSAQQISFRTEDFQCEFCSITSVDPYFFADFFNQTLYLSLSGNNLTSANFFETRSNFTLQLRRINLSYNQIKKIEFLTFANLKNVIELFLNNNEISVIDNGSFSHLKNLKTISLANNNILQLPIDFYSLTPELVGLDVSFNSITIFGLPNDEVFGKLQYLKLNNNPLKCGCINAIRSWQEKRNIYLTIDNNYCNPTDTEC